MEEPRSTGSEPARRTTDKLPTENIATSNTTSQTTSNNNGQQNQAPTTVDSLQLFVVEGFQVGRGVARIDPTDITKLGCQPGDIVLITGARTSAAKVVPSAMVDRGQQTIQMDSQVRQNSASGLGERVTVRKAKVRTAEKIMLLPLSGGAPIQESDLQYIARYLVGLPVTIGDLLRAGTPGTAPREFLIISTTPATPSYALRKRTTGELEALVPPP
ncbi:MAG TPA: ATPase, partial [Ktedonobacteraceae bacterium]|nr:ATPase [Ktedonobacteraceae bacterium]